MTEPHHITIIGSGFGALSSVREIRQRDPGVRITLIAPRAELHYLPGIIWIPCGLRTREQLVVPLANFFARMKVQHLAAEVTGKPLVDWTLNGQTPEQVHQASHQPQQFYHPRPSL